MKLQAQRIERVDSCQCSFCNQLVDKAIKLSDGAICNQCAQISGATESINIYLLDHSVINTQMSCNDVQNALNDMRERMQLISEFSATRTSPSGKIVVDDNHKVFYIKKTSESNMILHRVSDISHFFLEYEYVEKHGSGGDRSEVRSGHIMIKTNEMFDIEKIKLPVKEKLFTQRLEVQRVYEPDLLFLEQISGKRRDSVPNKLKLF